MNLMKYFNYNYMIQNLKKSKSTLALFLGIMPVISVIVFMILTNNVLFGSIDLIKISLVNYVGIYFIPIMVSFCLFGFIYKKKSVDFINSMPLSRKTIFTTNTITGIILLVTMVVLSGLSIYIASLFTNIIIPFKMIIDYIIIWSVAYIFVFILSNVAASISGNGITQVIVTLLLIFFIPFTLDFISAGSNLVYGFNMYDICFSNDNTTQEVCYYIYQNSTTNYTLPYNNIHNLLIGSVDSPLLNYISLTKMLIISVIGFVAGKMLLLKRKMEINETTFKNLKIHSLVKALTMYPIVLIMGAFVINESMSLLGAICCLLFLVLYFFIYDLITKRSISDFKNSIIHLCIVITVLFSVSIIINDFVSSNHDIDIYLDSNDVDSYKMSFDNTSISEFDYVNITNRKSIEMITDVLMERDNYEYSDKLEVHEIIVNVNNKEFKIYAHIEVDAFNKIVKQIESTNDIKNTKTLLDNDGNYAVALNYGNIKTMTNDSKIIDEAIRVIKEDVQCKINKVPVKLYNYHNGIVNAYEIDSCTSIVLSNYVDSMIRKENERFLNEIKDLTYTQAGHKGFTYGINSYIEKDIYMYDKEIYNFMKTHNDKDFTIRENYIYISGYIGNKKYSYHTNDVLEFTKLFD